MNYLKAVYAEYRLGLKQLFSYKMNFFSEMATIAILYFALVFMNSGNSLGSIYNTYSTDSKSLMLLGYVFWNFSVSTINFASSEISSEATKGTLEQKLMACVGLPILLFGKLLSGNTLIILETIMLLIISKIFFNIGLSFTIISIVSLLITLIGMYGFGLIFGGLALKEKRISKLVFIVQIILLFIGGIFNEKGLIFNIHRIIPLYNGIIVARQSIANSQYNVVDLNILILSSLFWIIVGVYIFKYFFKKARKLGILNQY
ncbi:ABC-2 type transport system permease protein [Caminicella sporogenes DSM 14501]|uniref:ABC-2 type transport system permease protein n=1 Tax=Caminicella sporogenes DSM 14501 TaxID=1121266 RepID=A0A1M6NKA6_9FIRM|nr:ABC transporter permease [Caminicella sporogenes]RKD22171.1 hypothetical protein BET04_05995 [Caminicella sporogenes]SHJ96198.1 ABC-2 type transport system permease protein [Caminicella sporogenes DSM 14501]